MTPKISVIIPHHKRFNLLKQTLKSVLFQTYTNWEVILVDDYSEPDCIRKIKAHIHSESRFKLITKTKEAKGAPVSRNIGLNHAKGQYVLFLDSDDILAPFALEQRFKVFESTELPLDAVIAPTIRFKKIPGDLSEVWGILNASENVISRFTKCDSPWHTMSALWNKKFISKIGGWDETLASYQDWELHIRALLFGLRYHEINDYDNFYRENSDEQSIARRHFNDTITQGRFKAFSLVIKQIKPTNNKIWIKSLHSLVIRNLVLLIDNGKVAIVSKLLQDHKTYNLSVIDKKILVLIKRNPDSWRYRRLTQIFINLFWKHLDYNPWEVSKRQKIDLEGNEKAFQYNYKQLLLN